MLTTQNTSALVSNHQRGESDLTMKVLIIRDTVANKKPVFVGDVVEVPDQEAKELMLMKKAQPVPASNIAHVDVVPEIGKGEVETAELHVPEIETTVKRGKRKE